MKWRHITLLYVYGATYMKGVTWLQLHNAQTSAAAVHAQAQHEIALNHVALRIRRNTKLRHK
jgi:hypothetical protein